MGTETVPMSDGSAVGVTTQDVDLEASFVGLRGFVKLELLAEDDELAVDDPVVLVWDCLEGLLGMEG